MGWTSYNTPVKRTATEDITCYKVFHKMDIIWRVEKTLDLTFEAKIKELKSLYRQYKYIPYNINPKINIVYPKCTIGDLDLECAFRIKEGYHSFETLKIARLYTKEYCHIIECIIPKGSEYYINESRCIVSSNIIITDKIVG